MFNLLIPAAVGAALTRLSPLSASRRGAVRMMGGFGASQDSFRYTGRVRPGKRSPTREVPPRRRAAPRQTPTAVSAPCAVSRRTLTLLLSRLSTSVIASLALAASPCLRYA